MCSEGKTGGGGTTTTSTTSAPEDTAVQSIAWRGSINGSTGGERWRFLCCIVLYCIAPLALELLQPGGVHSRVFLVYVVHTKVQGAVLPRVRRVRRSPSAMRFNNGSGCADGWRGGSRREHEKEKQERLDTTRRRKTSAAKVMTHF